MTVIATKPKLHNKKHSKKKQLSKKFLDVGTPLVPLRQVTVKQEHELLCDWENAS